MAAGVLGRDDRTGDQRAAVFRQHRCVEVGGGPDFVAVLADLAVDDVGSAQGVLSGVAEADCADAFVGAGLGFSAWQGRLAATPESGCAFPVAGRGLSLPRYDGAPGH
ncbi:hypothetical protein D9M71_623490 [compost metagenome]